MCFHSGGPDKEAGGEKKHPERGKNKWRKKNVSDTAAGLESYLFVEEPSSHSCVDVGIGRSLSATPFLPGAKTCVEKEGKSGKRDEYKKRQGVGIYAGD